MNTTLYTTAPAHFTYDDAQCFLTLTQGAETFDILIGPIGLIEVGLALCQFGRTAERHSANLLKVEKTVYQHPDGVFLITIEDGALIFTEGNKVESPVQIADANLIDFGLALIQHGHDLQMNNSEPDESFFGGRVTWKDGA
jgi:hypothetical protein